MEPFSIALLTLAAVLTGALLPLIFQALMTLRSAQRVLDQAGPQLVETLHEVSVTSQEIIGVARDVGGTLDQVRGTVRTAAAIGNAIGPAVVAAVQAFRTIRANDARDDRDGTAGPTHNSGGHAVGKENFHA